MSDFSIIEDKMVQAGVARAAIDSFKHSFQSLASNASGLIEESDITPACNIPSWESLTEKSPLANQELIAQSVCIKLNGGLGTSMGLQKAKSLLPIKGDKTFLDLIIEQIQDLRQICGMPVRLLLMNSFSTSEDTLHYLSKYTDGGFNQASEVELMQNRVPKLLTKDLSPASCPSHPDLEWCPPGHGDIYPALLGSGWLDKLLASGVKYAFISNSDNLGAQMDLRFLHWFAHSGAPFVMEVTRRTESDKKGGHLAIRKQDNRLILREVAQCPESDLANFQNIDKHQYFNTNTLWIRLDILKSILKTEDGTLPLPTIRNLKTLDPRDASTAPVYQLETAMGAAIECFSGAQAVSVPRTRFFPVKTCSDLFLLRSDAVDVSPQGKVSLAPETQGKAPIIDLDPKLFKLVDSLDSLGLPSLKDCTKLTLRGPHHFEEGVRIIGTANFDNPSAETKYIPAGDYGQK